MGGDKTTAVQTSKTAADADADTICGWKCSVASFFFKPSKMSVNVILQSCSQYNYHLFMFKKFENPKKCRFYIYKEATVTILLQNDGKFFIILSLDGDVSYLRTSVAEPQTSKVPEPTPAPIIKSGSGSRHKKGGSRRLRLLTLKF